MTAVFLALGSSLGDRAKNIADAVGLIGAVGGVSVVRESSIIETAPEGGVARNNFLNCAVAVETELAPDKLLAALMEIEKKLGRKRGKKWGDRLIDIDIILFGARVIEEEGLNVPHPLFREREFVMGPLAEIAPDAVDPVTGKTVAELAGSSFRSSK